jgi:hypothetical protein
MLIDYHASVYFRQQQTATSPSMTSNLTPMALLSA